MSHFAGPNYSWPNTNWERPMQTAWSVYGSVGGWGTMSHSSSGVAARTYRSPCQASGMFTIGDGRETMQGLNGRLATYLETVHILEQANCKLELQIHETVEKMGPEVNDYSRYNVILVDLRKQVRTTGKLQLLSA